MILKEFETGLWRGSHPQTDEDIELIYSKGIKTIINLQIDGDRLMPAGVEDIQIPCSNFTPPGSIAVDLALKYLQEKPHPILVHCHAGKDRTGYVVAAYRCKVQGWSFEQAYKEMLDEGFHYIRYAPLRWKQHLEAYVGEWG